MRRLFFILLAACGGGGGDSTPIDAPVDVLVDAPPPPPNTFRFVWNKQKLPANNQQARDFGLDLNNDQTIDNQLGMVIGTLAGQGFDSQAAADTAVTRGDAIVLVELFADSFTTSIAPATYAQFVGTNPMPTACAGTSDTTCGKHLTGSASFTAAPAPRAPALTGAVTAGTITLGPGMLHLPIAFGEGAPMEVALIGARVRLRTTSATGIMDGVVGGAVTVAERDAKIYPRMAKNANDAIMRDCTSLTPPDCGCASGSSGKTQANLFDTSPKDCTVTVDEIANNTLIMSLFAPDVTIDNQQALSVGIGFTAVSAGFVP